LADFASDQDEDMWVLTNLLIRGKVVSLIGDVVVKHGKPAGIACRSYFLCGTR
jgi:hypothetical protein